MRGGLKILQYRGVHFEASSLKKVLFLNFLSSKKKGWPFAETTRFLGYLVK
jgi:hypothetical protein